MTADEARKRLVIELSFLKPQLYDSQEERIMRLAEEWVKAAKLEVLEEIARSTHSGRALIGSVEAIFELSDLRAEIEAE